MLDMTTAASAAAPTTAPDSALAQGRLLLMPDAARSDELVRRYRLARLRLEPRDRVDPSGRLKRSYD